MVSEWSRLGGPWCDQVAEQSWQSHDKEAMQGNMTGEGTGENKRLAPFRSPGEVDVP